MAWFGACIGVLHHWIWLALIAGIAGLGIYGSRMARGRAGGQRGFAAKGLKVEARRQWSRRLADASFDGLLVHRNGTILQMNRALVRMLGYREVELLGTHFSNLGAPAQVTALRTELETPLPQISEFTLLHADTSERFVEMASHTLEMDGLPATVTAIRDLTAMRALEARLAYLVNNDALTGLPNRATFIEKLQAAVMQNDKAGGTTAVLTLELAQLRTINETFGRNGGDALLCQIAGRLCKAVQEGDMVARLSGKKFAVLQPHQGAPNRTAALTSRIEAMLAEPFIVEGKAISASMAIGVAIYPEHATGAEGLITASLSALRMAVETGGIQIFSYAQTVSPPAAMPQAAVPGSVVRPSLVMTQR